MISTNMREYDYYLYEDENEYGETQLSKKTKGKINMAIYLVAKTKEDSINFTKVQYQGVTLDENVSDKMVIKYGNKKLKILYVIEGRYKQAIMTKV